MEEVKKVLKNHSMALLNGFLLTDSVNTEEKLYVDEQIGEGEILVAAQNRKSMNHRTRDILPQGRDIKDITSYHIVSTVGFSHPDIHKHEYILKLTTILSSTLDALAKPITGYPNSESGVHCQFYTYENNGKEFIISLILVSPELFPSLIVEKILLNSNS